LCPAAVDEAAERFYCHCLLRRAVHLLRQEAHRSRVAQLTAADQWRRRQLAAVFQVWRVHAIQAADWLQAASITLRRRWLLRRWRMVAAERIWQREAEAAADEFARHRLLTTGLAAWRQSVQHEQWRDTVHEAVMHMRLRNMLRRCDSMTAPETASCEL